MNLILGTLNFDYKYVSEEFTSDKINNILDICLNNNINQIDTAYYYNNCEKLLGNTNKMHHFKVSSKANPWFNNDFTLNKFGQLSRNNILYQLNTSLQNLKINKFHIYYIHCWDYETNILETLLTFNELYNLNKFEYFGVSNISKEQLLQILDLCDKYNLIKPTYYQGIYNIFCRKIEELFPIFEKYNITFIIYNPLAGGLLTGKYDDLTNSSRFFNNTIYNDIFLKNKNILQLCKNINIQLAYKWINQLYKNKKYIIFGISTIEQLNYLLSINLDEKLTNNELNIIDTFYLEITDSPNYYY